MIVINYNYSPIARKIENTRARAHTHETDKELVDAHASINSDFTTKIALDFLLLYRLRRFVR